MGSGHDAGVDAKICENYLRFYVYIRKIAGTTPDPIVTAV